MIKTTRIYIFISLISQIVFSCQYEENAYININVLNQDLQKTNLSLIADDIQYIPLSNDSLLDKILKIKYEDGFFYIKDKKSLFLKFNEDGDFVTEIGKRGNGPGEYNYVNDFAINNKTGNVYCINYKFKKIYNYNSNGDFINAIDLSFDYPTRINYSSQGLFLYYNNSHGNNQYSFQLIDNNGQNIKLYLNPNKFELKDKYLTFKSDCLFYTYNDTVCFKEIHSDSVYYLEKSNLKLRYILQSGLNGFTQKERINPDYFINNMSKFIMQTNLFETQNYIFYEYWFQNRNKILVYNKGKDYSFEINEKIGFINDLDGGPNFVPKFVKTENSIISLINAYELKTYVESDNFKDKTPKFPEKKKELEKLANSLNENDNPVLMLVKLKE